MDVQAFGQIVLSHVILSLVRPEQPTMPIEPTRVVEP
jgi:hypothetical protein